MEPRVDTSKVSLKQIDKMVAKDFVVKHHYSHKFTSCRYALGIYYEKDEHFFFDGKYDKLIGVMIYGHPVGASAVNSVTVDDSVKDGNILELTRLVIFDGFGSNIESYVIGQSFKWLKKNAPDIKVLLSYADPEASHAGIIYQATNWLYQGRGQAALAPSYSIKETPNGPWIHSRSAGARWTSRRIKTLAHKIGHVFWKKEESFKHRYIYFLCNKKDRKHILKNLKLDILPYPEPNQEFNPPIQEIQVIDGKIHTKWL